MFESIVTSLNVTVLVTEGSVYKMTFVLSFCQIHTSPIGINCLWEGLVELLLVKIESHLSTLQFG